MGVAELVRAMAARRLVAPLAVFLPQHARRAEADALLREGAAACLRRPLLAAEVGALWQLPMQQLVFGFNAESSLREEARSAQRAFASQMQEYGWPAF